MWHNSIILPLRVHFFLVKLIGEFPFHMHLNYLLNFDRLALSKTTHGSSLSFAEQKNFQRKWRQRNRKECEKYVVF